MLNSSWNTNYKVLARKSKFRECFVAENPLSSIVVDVRSRLFRYIRLQIPNRRLDDKIKCVFGLVTDKQKEVSKAVGEALRTIKSEVDMMLVEKHTYVLCSQEPCPFKRGLKEANDVVAAKRKIDLIAAIESFKENMFDFDRLLECHVAFESYLISNVDDICCMIPNSLNGLLPGSMNGWSASDVLLTADDKDHFESDRLCARTVVGSSAVLSEDFDCVALFGADMMVKEVWPSFFTYTMLTDVMDAFSSKSRSELIKKCCILGTDYNHGIKSIGPVKIKKIDENKTSALFETCLSLQSISKERFADFILGDEAYIL